MNILNATVRLVPLYSWFAVSGMSPDFNNDWSDWRDDEQKFLAYDDIVFVSVPPYLEDDGDEYEIVVHLWKFDSETESLPAFVSTYELRFEGVLTFPESILTIWVESEGETEFALTRPKQRVQVYMNPRKSEFNIILREVQQTQC